MRTTELWKRTRPTNFKFVRISRYSQSFYEYTSTYELETNLVSMLTGGNIRIAVEFTTEEDKYLKEVMIPISRAHADEIKMIMESNCKAMKIYREMFLENMPMVSSPINFRFTSLTTTEI